MDNAEPQQLDATDTLRPPPPRMPRIQREPSAQRERDRMAKARTKSYPVTIRCESEEQRAMLIDWLGEAGFEVEPRQ